MLNKKFSFFLLLILIFVACGSISGEIITEDYLGLQKGLELKYSFEFVEGNLDATGKKWEEVKEEGTFTQRVTGSFSRQGFDIFIIETKRVVLQENGEEKTDSDIFYAAKRDGMYYEFNFDPSGEYFSSEFMNIILGEELKSGDEFRGRFGIIGTEYPLLVQKKDQVRAGEQKFSAWRIGNNKEDNEDNGEEMGTIRFNCIHFVPYLGFIKQELKMETYKQIEGEREKVMEKTGLVELIDYSLEK